MKKRPLSITIIAWCYFLAPIGNILQIAYFNHWPILGPRSVVYHLSGYEWFILAMLPITGVGIFKVTKFGYITFVSFSAFLILHNTYAYLTNNSYSFTVMLLFQSLTVGI